MATQTWVRNPQRSIKYALLEGVDRYIFDRALLQRYGRSAHSFIRQHFAGSEIQPEFILIGDQGAQLFSMFTPPDNPLAVWPVWNAGTEDIETLEWYLDNPPGLDRVACMDSSVVEGLRPRFGQENWVFITGLLVGRDPTKRKLAAEIVEMCHAADTKVHLTGQQAFPLMFGMPWDSVDYAPEQMSMDGLTMPNGVRLTANRRDEWVNFSDWIEVVGFTAGDVQDNYVRTRYHIRSVRWAAENYTDEIRVKRRFTPTEDDARNLVRRGWKSRIQTQATNWRKPKTIASRILPMFESADGDKAMCNHCVLRVSCPLARADMVCALEGTEMGELARRFGTRSADSIIAGLNQLLELQAERLEEQVEEERSSGEHKDEVRKSIDSVFKNGTALAKLIDPRLNGGGKTVNNQTLNINGAAQVPTGDPRQQVAAIVQALQEAGVPRGEVTADMIKTMLANANSQPALEGVVVQSTSEKE